MQQQEPTVARYAAKTTLGNCGRFPLCQCLCVSICLSYSCRLLPRRTRRARSLRPINFSLFVVSKCWPTIYRLAKTDCGFNCLPAILRWVLLVSENIGNQAFVRSAVASVWAMENHSPRHRSTQPCVPSKCEIQMAQFPTEVKAFHDAMLGFPGIVDVTTGLKDLSEFTPDTYSFPGEFGDLPHALLRRTNGGLENEAWANTEFEDPKTQQVGLRLSSSLVGSRYVSF